MREFNGWNIIKVVSKNYQKSFPNKKIKISILTYGFKNDDTGNITNMFFCFDPNHDLIGFAVHYGAKNILRFYNHEGADAGLEINMIFKPLKEGRGVKRTKITH